MYRRGVAGVEVLVVMLLLLLLCSAADRLILAAKTIESAPVAAVYLPACFCGWALVTASKIRSIISVDSRIFTHWYCI